MRQLSSRAVLRHLKQAASPIFATIALMIATALPAQASTLTFSVNTSFSGTPGIIGNPPGSGPAFSGAISVDPVAWVFIAIDLSFTENGTAYTFTLDNSTITSDQLITSFINGIPNRTRSVVLTQFSGPAIGPNGELSTSTILGLSLVENFDNMGPALGFSASEASGNVDPFAGSFGYFTNVWNLPLTLPDGSNLTQVNAQVPLPAGLPLLLVGLGGFALLRRKARLA